MGALVVGAMTVGLGTAHAEPAAPAAKGINYSVQLVDAQQPGTPKSVVTRLQGGTFQLSKTEVAAKPGEEATQVDTVDIKDAEGATVVTLPLTYTFAGQQVQVKPEIKGEGKELELVPDKTVAPIANQTQVEPQQITRDGNRVVLKDVASPIENQRAMNDFASKFGIATAVGGFVGTAIGAVVGCIFGLPLFGVGCLAGLPLGAGIGGILGTVAVGGPALIATAVDLVNTMTAAPGSTQWSDENLAKQQQAQNAPQN
ncbi:hypothetical protein [Nocardia pseudobrasiliensis]|uniref:DUF8020 domain-containing protein n=1 Tax=Nocardia pseudobrasiliensis TaxID=45979 RepID=A0A370HXP1_9NOCA|nr:hypothetical protein [Nocardia pseudobrasiliensis]RDI63239.1 hypothetical protein DFR76_111258 [Nocardia pseudobrasiliensis]